MKETELAEKVINYLKNAQNDFYFEVATPGGTCTDAVIKRGDDLIALEFKTSLSISLIEQAVKNKRYYSYSYAIVPKKRETFAYTILKQFGIGLIVCDWKSKNKTVVEVIKPQYNENIKKPKLRDWQKRSISGSQSDRLTAFKVFLESVEEQLLCNGSMTHKELFQTCYRHYTSAVYLRTNLVNHIKTGVIKSLEYKAGKFTLKENPDT